MSTLGTSTKDRIFSRLLFYTCVTFTMWLLGEIIPSETEIQVRRDKILGVAQPVILFPGDTSPEVTTLPILSQAR